MKENWFLPDGELVDYIAAQLGIDRQMGAFLVNRGVSDLKAAKEFLYPNLNFTDAFEIFPQMEKAVSVILDCASSGGKIAILADSDADGISGLLILKDALSEFNPETFVCEGASYGIGKGEVQKVVSSGAKVLITVDVGISQKDELEEIERRGIKVVICDHHRPSAVLPGVSAIINPACEENLPQMSASLVAFYLGCAIVISRVPDFNKIKITCDVETTGMSASTEQIIEIGAVKFKGFRLLETFSSFVKPSKSLSPEITFITGIKDRDLEDAPPPEEVFKKFADWVEDFPVIFHNASFDVSFISAAFRKYLGRSFDNKILDTLPIARKMYPSMSHRLDFLKDFFGIKNSSHRALPDADTTFRLFNILSYEKNPSYRFFIDQNLPLAAIGTLADNIPLVGKSRWVVREGIKKLPKTKRFVFKMLFSALDIKHPDDYREISFKLIPFINTSKRMSEPGKILELFAAKTKKGAREIMDYISTLSFDRKSAMKYGFETIEKEARRQNGAVIILRSEEISPGFRGVFASRLNSEFNRPVLFFTREKNFWVGSARAQFDILSVLKRMENLCEAGGHPFACGVRVRVSAFEEFEKQLREVLSKDFSEPKVKIDAEWDKWFEKNYKKMYEAIEPFGSGNPYPTLLLRNAELRDVSEKKFFYLLMLKKDDKVFNILSREEISLGFFDFVFHIERSSGKFYFFLDDYGEAAEEKR